LFVVAIKRI